MKAGTGSGPTSPKGGKGNVFRGCRSWWNTDDGYDLISADEAVVIEDCWAWLNGYLPGTMTRSKNGNGIKAGGYGRDVATFPSPVPMHVVRRCLSFNNGAAGFYANHHPASIQFYNNTSYNNNPNFNMLGITYAGADTGVGIYRNNIAFSKTAISNGAGVDARINSWNLSFEVAAGDFQSVSTTGVEGARKADGGLPDIPFLRLKAGSKLIDAGVDVGLAFAGKAPDLGAFETGVVTGAGARVSVTESVRIRPATRGRIVIETALQEPGRIEIRIHDLTGRLRQTERFPVPSGDNLVDIQIDRSIVGPVVANVVGPGLSSTRIVAPRQ